MSIKISETFAPTIQGEGIHAGQRVGFIRVAECNLSCTWCDTPYTWDWSRFNKDQEVAEYELKDLAEIIESWHEEFGIATIIITGGEPLLHQNQIIELIKLVHQEMPWIGFEIETNGTIMPKNELLPLIQLFSVSPKLSHSGDPLKKRIKDKAMWSFANLSTNRAAQFKFVIKSKADLDEVNELAIEFGIFQEDIWIMPEGVTAEDQIEALRSLAADIIDKGFNISTRLHVLIWGDRRGV